VEALIVAALRLDGWPAVPPNQSDSAETWAANLVERRSYITITELSRVAAIHRAIAETVDDPHDWDSVGAVINILDLLKEWT
jgi:hypothetical protein